jgi:acyl-CoA reductase-like NAD-dependent aldehyde dehydrogenase
VRGPRERRREGVRRDEVPRLMKKSGYGREKGLESLASYTQVKNVCIKYT